MTEEPLRIFWNKNLRGKISPGKLAAHAAHAALAAYGITYTHPIVVLGAGLGAIEKMPVVIRDAGLTELAPGTVTCGTQRRVPAPVAPILLEELERGDTIAEAESFEEALFAIAEKYDLPLTNNEPRFENGVYLRPIGDFVEDIRRAIMKHQNKEEASS